MTLSPIRIISLVFVALALSACQLRPTTTGTFEHPNQIDRWAMSGRLVSPSSHSLDPKKLRELFKP